MSNTDDPCSQYKFDRQEEVDGTWWKKFNSANNPFGNYHEPLPYPAKRQRQAEESKLPDKLWWNLRNPLHNFNHFMIGITPKGNPYEWISPECAGWIREQGKKTDNYEISWWKKGKISLPIFKFNNFLGFEGYLGWMERGNFGAAFRKSKKQK